jgi:hypothetical protein
MAELTTNEVAIHMLRKGGFYTAARLAKETELTAKEASGKLHNIRKCGRYLTTETPLPNRTVKVRKVLGSEYTNESLWKLAIGFPGAKQHGI